MELGGIIELSYFLENYFKEEIKIAEDFQEKYKLNHSGTIGDMYEGLTNKILDKLIFLEKLNLKVVTGQILNHKGTLSTQIDCMIVTKVKEQIPNSEKYICDINDVIAVLEVKKNLNKKDLKDASLKMQGIFKNFEIDKIKESTVEIEDLYRGYEMITGKPLEDVYDYIGENVNPTNFDSVLLNTLIWEYTMPLRIVLGYNGYASEESLKNGLLNLIEEKEINGGILSMPNLIIARNTSIIKLTGNPYAINVFNYKPNYFEDYWAAYGSYDKNPILILTEILWTRLKNKFPEELKEDIFGDYVKHEKVYPFVMMEFGQHKGKYGFAAIELPKFPERDNTELISSGWTPTKVDRSVFIIIGELCNERKLFLHSPLIQDLIKNEGITLLEFKQKLLETGYVKINQGRLLLRTTECACVVSPEGYLVGENKDGKMTKWLIENTPIREKN
ncbi:DUF6602 domain-containing protein [Cetobacterium somerae]